MYIKTETKKSHYIRPQDRPKHNYMYLQTKTKFFKNTYFTLVHDKGRVCRTNWFNKKYMLSSWVRRKMRLILRCGPQLSLFNGQDPIDKIVEHDFEIYYAEKKKKVTGIIFTWFNASAYCWPLIILSGCVMFLTSCGGLKHHE